MSKVDKKQQKQQPAAAGTNKKEITTDNPESQKKQTSNESDPRSIFLFQLEKKVSLPSSLKSVNISNQVVQANFTQSSSNVLSDYFLEQKSLSEFLTKTVTSSPATNNGLHTSHNFCRLSQNKIFMELASGDLGLSQDPKNLNEEIHTLTSEYSHPNRLDWSRRGS